MQLELLFSGMEIDIGVHALLVTKLKIFSLLLVKQQLFSGLLKGHGKKVKFRGIFRDRFAEKLANFTEIFRANFAKKKQSIKSGRFHGNFLGKFR